MNNLDNQVAAPSEGGSTARNENSIGAFNHLVESGVMGKKESLVANLIARYPNSTDKQLAFYARQEGLPLNYHGITALITKVANTGALELGSTVDLSTNNPCRTSTYIHDRSQWSPRLTKSDRKNKAAHAVHVLRGDLQVAGIEINGAFANRFDTLITLINKI